jgi:hypothetical protein
MKRGLIAAVLISLGSGLWAQMVDPAPDPAPGWDPKSFIIKNHVHEISGITTLSLATLTGIAGVTLATGHDFGGVLPKVHGALAYGTIAFGAVTLGLGLTAYSDRLDEVWPHAAFMGLAETGMIVNAFVLKPGSLPHRITGAASITSLGLGLLSIILIKAHEENP